MITEVEVRQRAEELGVGAHHVQKDYVFGWILWALYSDSPLSEQLVLAGGNCLRKGYYREARYSPDLDFRTTAELSEASLRAGLAHICQAAGARSGVVFRPERNLVQWKTHIDKDRKVLEARLYFQDILGEDRPYELKVSFDVTLSDRIYLPVQERRLLHPYSDAEQCGAPLRCLKLEEVLASKLKCLLQRRHSPDLHDFVFVTSSDAYPVNASEVVQAFLGMTVYGAAPRTVRDLLCGLPFGGFQPDWDEHLHCPDPIRLSLADAQSRFVSVVDSMFGSLPTGGSGPIFFPALMRNMILEAGRTQTLLEMTYNDVRRHVEPYSLKFKHSSSGSKEYLYVFDTTGGLDSEAGLKSFVPSGVQSMANTDVGFEPRWVIELAKAGEYFGERYFGGRPRRIASRPRQPRSPYGYRVQCPVCGRVFPRAKWGYSLRPHNAPGGYPCPGRIGVYYVT